MRILHIYKDYFPVVGGIENHIKMLAEAQAARGHQVTVLVTSRDRHTHIEQQSGVRVIFAARLATVSSTPISFEMPRWLGRETPDIAHLHFPYPWGEMANYFFGRARRTVITYHSDIIRQKYLRNIYGVLMHRVLDRADRIIATSPNYIASSSVLKRHSGKCVVVPLGIQVTRFVSNAPEPIKSLGAGVRLLFVGQLRYYKGLDYLMRAMTELPRAHLVIVGTGPLEHRLRSFAKELKIADRVEFAGGVGDAELPGYFAACDVFILPASERSEAFGVVQLEAMAAGKPVVCTEIGTGTNFVNVDGETGFVVPARDAHALASSIAKLGADPSLRARMGAAGRARVNQEFTLEKMVDRVKGVYEQVLQQRNPLS
jgi:glycosyltransferase involved in cell wall biosynthesis